MSKLPQDMTMDELLQAIARKTPEAMLEDLDDPDARKPALYSAIRQFLNDNGIKLDASKNKSMNTLAGRLSIVRMEDADAHVEDEDADVA
jgi:hypothetical protein